MKHHGPSHLIILALMGFTLSSSASAQSGRWEVIQQPGGYKVARVSFQGLATGIGLTCERGVPVIAVNLARLPSRNPARVELNVDGQPFSMGLVRNGKTNVWVAGVRDPKILDAMAGGSTAQVSVEGVAYGAASLAGSREAFVAALSKCYQVPQQISVTSTAVSVPTTLPPAALAAWEGHARAACKAGGDRFVSRRFTPSPYSNTNPGKLDDHFVAADLNGDHQPDFALVTDDQGCSQRDHIMFTDFVISGSSGYQRFEGFGGKQSIVGTKQCAGRDVMVLDTGSVWGWSGSKVAYLGNEDSLSCSSSAQKSAATGGTPSYDLDVRIVFTPRAAQYVAQRRQNLILTALYSGSPIPSRESAIDREEGTITIAEHAMTVPARSTNVRMTGAPINRQRLTWITRLDVHVEASMEVWEERWKIECKTDIASFAEPFKKVQASGVTITCDRAPQY